MKPPPPDSPVRVWIIEDNETFRRSLERLCTASKGLKTVRGFANAEAMFADLQQVSASERPEVVLLDIGLPGRNGLDSIAEIINLAPACRVVVLTVFEDESKIIQAISVGACGYLLKSALPSEIVDAIYEASAGGAPMSPHVARSVVNHLAKLTKPGPNVSLSPRERELLGLMVKGLTAKEIAGRLGVSIHTTDSHTRHLFSKLNVHNRSSAVARAIRDRLV